jgi:hypothetical protein
MSVIHSLRYEDPFTRISNGLLNDDRLSLEAIGLASWCQSKPANWVFHISHIKKVHKLGNTKLYRILQELVDCGYCVRSQARKNGRFATYDYAICDKPELLKDFCFKENITALPFSERGFSDSGKQTTSKNDLYQDLSKEIERERAPAPPTLAPKIEKPLRGECVRLSDVEMQKLEATYGAKAKQYIKEYDLYLEESGGKLRNGKAPVSCYAGIQRWASREKQFAPKTKEDKTVDNKAYATQKAQEINKNQNIFEACITVEGIRIEDRRKLGVEYNVSFKELAFREQFDNMLRKLGLTQSILYL